MKSLLKSFVACAAMCGFAAVGSAADWTLSGSTLTEEAGSGWVLKVSSVTGGYSVTGVNTAGTDSVIDLRGTITGGTIVRIGTSAFQNRSDITEFYMPDTVTVIDGDAFRSMSNLTTVQLSSTLETINNCAFYSSGKLAHVTPLLPTTFKSFSGGLHFKGCPIEGDCLVLCNPELTSIPAGGGSDGVFSGTKFKKVDMTGSGITSIGDNAFRSNHSLGEVIFPPTLKKIHNNCVMYDCTALTNAVFTSCPDDAAAVLKDGGWPFSGNPSMKFRIQICYTHGDWEKAVESLGSTLNKGSAVPGSDDYKTYAANFADYEEVVPLGTINISWNYRWIARYTEKSTDVKFSVTGDPEAQGDGFVNGYGDYGVVTEPMTCTAPACAALDGVAYECDGYVLQQSGDEGWVEVESGEGCTYTFNKTDAGIYRLVWQWKAAGYTLDVLEIPAFLGTVTVSDPDYRDVYYSAGSKVSVTVAPADGKTFGRWYGASDATSATIELTMDGNKSLTPYVAGPWTYDSGAKTVSNGYWTFNTSGSLDALTVTSVKKSGAVTDIDFSTGLEGGAFAGIDGTFYDNGSVTSVKMADTMTTIGSNTFRNTGKLKKVVLSSNLTTIDNCAFFSSAVAEVTPFLPDTVTSIVGAAFYGCGNLIVPELTLGDLGGDRPFKSANCMAFGGARRFGRD